MEPPVTEKLEFDVEPAPPAIAAPAVTVLDCVAVFFASFITASIGFVIGSAVGDGPLSETSGGLIGLWCGLVPGTLIISRVRGTGSLVSDFGLRFSLRDLIGIPAAIASQLLLLPIIYLVMTLVSRRDLIDDLQQPAKELTDQASPGVAFAFLAVLLIVGAPIVEEIFYRGMLFGALRRRFSAWVSVVVSGAVFGVVHFEPLLMLGLAAFGMVLAWLRERTGRLGASIVAHATFNAITVVNLAVGTAALTAS